jgi:hypothetical protein
MRPEAWPAVITASVLRRGAAVHVASLVLTLGAVLICMERPALGGTVLTLGMLEFYFAARVAIDAELFGAIAGAPELADFDRALGQLGFAGTGGVRPLVERARAALRLLWLQSASFGLQIAILAIGIAR